MRPDRVLDGLRRLSPVVSRVAAYAAAGGGASFFYHLATGSRAYLGIFADDFYYYAVSADRLVRFGRLTFDGLTLTNGFHPLWFLIILIVRIIARGPGTAFFVGVAVLIVAAMIVTYEALRSCASALGAPPELAAPFAALSVVASDALMISGMELVIAIPLYAALVTWTARSVGPPTPRSCATFSLLASLTVLARLDLVIAVGMLAAAWLVVSRSRPVRPLRALAASAAGGAPLLCYLSFNLWAFGSLLPTSGQAKQINTSSGINIEFLRTAVSAYGGRNVLLMASAFLVLVTVGRRMPSIRPEARAAAAVALAFPFVFYVANALLSAWLFFPWYAYPQPVAQLVAYVVMAHALGAVWPWAARMVLPAATLLLVTIKVPLAGLRAFLELGPGWGTTDNTLQAMATELDVALRGRDGVFAMGDKAGITTWILDRPVVQLEGLMADRKMLAHLRREDSLDRVVDDYGVDYLIVSTAENHPVRQGGCYLVTHPNPTQAGRRSAKTVGKICAEPIVQFWTPPPPHRWSPLLPLQTVVFDLRGSRRATLSPPPNFTQP